MAKDHALIVSNDGLVRQLGASLVHDGWVPVLAATVASALELAVATWPTVVAIDLDFAGDDVEILAARLRLARGRRLPLLGLSKRPISEFAAELGLYDWLRLPTGPGTFVRAINYGRTLSQNNGCDDVYPAAGFAVDCTRPHWRWTDDPRAEAACGAGV